MNSLHLLFFQLTSLFSLGINVYLYTHVLDLTKTLKDKTIADKILFEELESKIALIPEKVLDNPVAAITQSESVLGYVYLGVSIVVAIGLLYFFFTSSVASLGPTYPGGALKIVNIVPNRLVELMDIKGTAIKLEVITTKIDGLNTEVILVSIKRASDTVYSVAENIGSFLAEHPEVSLKVAQTISDVFDAAKGVF